MEWVTQRVGLLGCWVIGLQDDCRLLRCAATSWSPVRVELSYACRLVSDESFDGSGPRCTPGPLLSVLQTFRPAASFNSSNSSDFFESSQSCISSNFFNSFDSSDVSKFSKPSDSLNFYDSFRPRTSSSLSIPSTSRILLVMKFPDFLNSAESSNPSDCYNLPDSSNFSESSNSSNVSYSSNCSDFSNSRSSSHCPTLATRQTPQIRLTVLTPPILFDSSDSSDCCDFFSSLTLPTTPPPPTRLFWLIQFLRLLQLLRLGPFQQLM